MMIMMQLRVREGGFEIEAIHCAHKKELIRLFIFGASNVLSTV